MDTNRVFGAALVAAPLAMGLVSPAQAHFTFTIDQVGSNVVVTGSGSINLADFSNHSTSSGGGFIVPSNGGSAIRSGSGNFDSYADPSETAADIAFGTKGQTNANSNTGGSVGVGAYLSGDFEVDVPKGYASGTLLSGISSTYNNATLASLGLTVGTYTWSWGSGETLDDITLKINDAPAPAPVPGAGLLSLAFFALVAVRDRAGSVLKSALGRG